MAIELHHGLCVDTLLEDGICTPVEANSARDYLRHNGYERIKMGIVGGHLVETWDKNENIRPEINKARG